jgi:hypothetical protein
MDPVPADEASRALSEIGRRQEQVIELNTIPTWFWWAVAGLMLEMAAAVDSHRPVLVGVGTAVFVAGILGVVGGVVVGQLRHAKARDDLLGPAGVLAILAFVALVLAVALPTAFAVRAAGLPYPGTWGTLPGAVLLVAGGPVLMRYLRRVMLSHRHGAG